MDQTKLNESLNAVNNDSSIAEDIIYRTIKEYSSDLDDIMQKIYNDVISIDYPAINTIEKYFIELSSELYFMCERVEKLGVYDSISKARAQETYNNKYLEVSTSVVGKKPTVGETQAVSDKAAIYDKTVNDIYSRAYKILKNKVSAAETMVSTLSKILSHRIQESQLTQMQTGRRLLNEENAF